MSASPALRFAAYGGFLLLDDDGRVLAAQPIGDGDELGFAPPRAWQAQFTPQLEAQQRLQAVTLPVLRRGGATHFCWINPGESFAAGPETWTPAASGAFLYLFKGRPPLYFARE